MVPGEEEPDQKGQSHSDVEFWRGVVPQASGVKVPSLRREERNLHSKKRESANKKGGKHTDLKRSRKLEERWHCAQHIRLRASGVGGECFKLTRSLGAARGHRGKKREAEKVKKKLGGSYYLPSYTNGKYAGGGERGRRAEWGFKHTSNVRLAPWGTSPLTETLCLSRAKGERNGTIGDKALQRRKSRKVWPMRRGNSDSVKRAGINGQPLLKRVKSSGLPVKRHR